MLVKSLYAVIIVLVAAEMLPCQMNVRVPHPAEAGIGVLEDFSGGPLQNREDGGAYAGKPGGGRAVVQEDFGVRVGGCEVRGEEAAGDVENALG